MNAPAKLTAFGVSLAVLFGGGALAGGAIDPDRDEPREAHAGAANEKEHDTVSASTHTESAGTHDGAKADHPVRGLAVAENKLRLAVDDTELRRGTVEELRFRILDDAGRIVRDFDVEHEKRMHLIIARRDLTGFQHLHPEQAADGSWSTELRLEDAGSYRVFADFSHEDEAYTLAGDLRVDGAANLQPLPAPASAAVSDGGYDVQLDAGRARPGQEADLRFTITRDGEAVHTEPYLGAGGHLVALREGDLAFLHVHPTEHGDGDQAAAEHDDSVSFEVTFPTEGRYRLFLQFQHDGAVRTVALTQSIEP